MKIVGIFILALELLALAIQLKNECRKNNFTAASFKKSLSKVKYKMPFVKEKPKSNLWDKFPKINPSKTRRKSK